MYTHTTLLTALALSIAITGIHTACTWQGMILRPLRDRLDPLLPVWLRKPLYDCPVCMASLWTLLYSFTLGAHLSFIETGWLILLVAGINTYSCIALNHWTDYGC